MLSRLCYLKAKMEAIEDVWDGEFITKEEMEEYVDDLRSELKQAEASRTTEEAQQGSRRRYRTGRQ